MNQLTTYQTVFDYSPDALVVTNDQQEIVMVNRQAEEIFGLKQQELLTKKIGDVINFGEHKITLQNFYDSTELPISNLKIGEKKDISIFLKDLRVLSIELSMSLFIADTHKLASFSIRDITERKNTFKEIIENEKLFHEVLDNMLEGVQIISSDYKYIYVNDALVAQSGGYSKEELLNHTMMEKYPGIENSAVFKSIKHCMRTHLGEVMVNEFDFPDGTKGFFQLSIQPTHDGVFILSMDISDRINHLNEIAAQNELLTNKNKELEQFTYIASHDLQEPLRSLISFSTVLEKEYKDVLSGRGEMYLNYIQKSSQRMQNLVKGLLDYARIGREKKLEEVDLDVMVQNVLNDFTLKIDETNAKFEIGNLPTLNGYAVELQQLFQNVISNSLKYQKKGTIPKIVILSEEEEDKWLFKVKDNGIGIDSNNLDKIFVIFKRLHNRDEYEGEGIGLSHCKKIAELHKGKIWIESEVDKGSVVHFTVSKKLK